MWWKAIVFDWTLVFWGIFIKSRVWIFYMLSVFIPDTFLFFSHNGNDFVISTILQVIRLRVFNFLVIVFFIIVQLVVVFTRFPSPSSPNTLLSGRYPTCRWVLHISDNYVRSSWSRSWKAGEDSSRSRVLLNRSGRQPHMPWCWGTYGCGSSRMLCNADRSPTQGLGRRSADPSFLTTGLGAGMALG